MISAVSICFSGGCINIFNLYNPPDSNAALTALHSWLSTHPPLDTTSMLWCGDFNKHNPMWTSSKYLDCCQRSDSEHLLELIASHNMVLTILPATPTYQSDAHQTWSTLDLIFSQSTIQDHILSCDISLSDHLPSSDHLPVHTILDVTTHRAKRLPPRNFRNVEWAKFGSSLQTQLDLLLPDARGSQADPSSSPLPDARTPSIYMLDQ
ncbi:hypothetical protein M422DRAFT_273201 [Sphaerobolus stellatus SS14]|uniref:Endonuclease/exonuclease/phosphatase domain-containing protein n=1 Tax=Sphaerobolus stellatus (strain SS14) TaxID=990650 RepID=A0A0C9U9N3_SPHS4|nr:hypothetical protein M422DRAFT_273201 [Sphaerobolus stellatus SS14]